MGIYSEKPPFEFETLLNIDRTKWIGTTVFCPSGQSGNVPDWHYYDDFIKESVPKYDVGVIIGFEYLDLHKGYDVTFLCSNGSTLKYFDQFLWVIKSGANNE